MCMKDSMAEGGGEVNGNVTPWWAIARLRVASPDLEDLRSLGRLREGEQWHMRSERYLRGSWTTEKPLAFSFKRHTLGKAGDPRRVGVIWIFGSELYPFGFFFFYSFGSLWLDGGQWRGEGGG